MRTEWATAARNIAVRVADVHKPLLSLSKCADAVCKSRFGQTAGSLIDCENGEINPLHRRRNLYVLHAWVRLSPNAEQHSGGQVPQEKGFPMPSLARPAKCDNASNASTATCIAKTSTCICFGQSWVDLGSGCSQGGPGGGERGERTWKRFLLEGFRGVRPLKEGQGPQRTIFMVWLTQEFEILRFSRPGTRFQGAGPVRL